MIITDLFSSKDSCHVCGQTPCNCTSITEGKQWPDTSNSLAKRSAVATSLKGAPEKAGRTSGMTVATRVDPTITPTSVKRIGSDKPIPSFLQKGVAEGDKKPTSQVEKARKLGQTHKTTGFTGKNPFKDHPSDVQQAYKTARREIGRAHV